MFEQTFIRDDQHDNKRYTVLVSLLLQITTIGALIIAPLIYTQVLPRAQLRSVFAAPVPAPPALPKAPIANVNTQPAHSLFRVLDTITLTMARPIQRVDMSAATNTPDLQIGIPVSETLPALRRSRRRTNQTARTAAAASNSTRRCQQTSAPGKRRSVPTHLQSSALISGHCQSNARTRSGYFHRGHQQSRRH